MIREMKNFICPTTYFAGQVARKVFLQNTGELETIGIKFYPDGIYRLFRIPGKELSGKAIEPEVFININFSSSWLSFQLFQRTTLLSCLSNYLP